MRTASAIVALLLASLPATAANIAGNDGWMTLTEGVARYDIDPDFAGAVLDAGGEVNCVRVKPNGKNGYQTLNGWLLNGDDMHVVTSGHFMFDDEDQKRTNFDNCYFAINRDVLATTEADYPRLKIDPDPANYRLGGPDPAGHDTGHDRAILPLLAPPASPPDGSRSVVPLTSDASFTETVEAGDEIFVVSAARPFHLKTSKGGFEPMLQRCFVIRVDTSTSNQSNQIRTDCDSFKGVSGSLAFLRDQRAVGGLRPVAVLSGNSSYDGQDNLPPHPENNTTILVLIDRTFFTMEYSGDDALAESDRNAKPQIIPGPTWAPPIITEGPESYQW